MPVRGDCVRAARALCTFVLKSLVPDEAVNELKQITSTSAGE